MIDRPFKTAVFPSGAREGDIPYHCKWSDGSVYDVRRIDDHHARRSYWGALFGIEAGTVHTETFSLRITTAQTTAKRSSP